MQAGEIQRWRFVGATMEGAAQISIDFNGPENNGLTAQQIAMDGVQFNNTNYLCQPLLHTTQVTPPCTLQPVADPTFNLSPGNRADFLVQAPSQPGVYGMTFAVFGNTDRQGTGQAQGGPRGRGKKQPTVENIKRVLARFAAAGTAPALLTVNVVACTDHCGMTYPAAMPPMPPYLSDIPSTTDGTQAVQFRLDDPSTGKPGKTGKQPQVFGIGVQNQNGGATQQFKGDCANFTEPLERTETWTISQNTDSGAAPFHVFHIHTNPFQLVSSGTNDGKSSITYPSPIWMDSITLPSNTAAVDGYPTSPNSTVVIRQRFEDYTGAYVLHCHFLGHEDRGMMLMVQTVCPNATGSFGQTVASGGADNCSICGGYGSPCPVALPPCGSTASPKKSVQHERKKKQ